MHELTRNPSVKKKTAHGSGEITVAEEKGFSVWPRKKKEEAS